MELRRTSPWQGKRMKPWQRLREVQTKGSASYAAPFAALLEGRILVRMGKFEDARKVLANLVAAYPQSPAGRAAGAQLDALAPFLPPDVPKSRSVGGQRIHGGNQGGVEVVLELDRPSTARRANGNFGQQGSARFDDDGTRGDASFDQSAPGNPYAAGAFEISRSLPMNRKITGSYRAGELQASVLFNDYQGRIHLAAQSL